jgi:hypothetical protein
VQVRNNGDFWVYRGSERVGETAYWDEFGDEGKVIQDARIDFGTSWDGMIAHDNDYANSLGLYTTAQKSHNEKYFDIKSDRGVAPHDVGTGRLLNGKYATAESAGNYLAGMNMATGTYLGGIHLTRDQGMKLAGALQQKHFTKKNAGVILTFGRAYGPAPYYGETTYAGRRIDEGFAAGLAHR